jgi:undecaprenyl-diphosphatase
MSWIEAVILGIIQGLTEFLPVSSSGHLTLTGTLFGLSGDDNFSFAIVLHIATVLSTVVVLWKDISFLFKGLFSFKWNDETRMIVKILISMIPVGIVGVFFEDIVKSFFGSGFSLIGCMLLLTSVLLIISYYAKPRQKTGISFRDAFIIGLSQAIAVVPGLSRSGTTIATGIMLGNKKEQVARFSFLMVIIPILGEASLDMLKIIKGEESLFAGSTISLPVIFCGFMAAFIAGTIACKWMINLVKRGKLIYFAYYCIVVGLFALVYSFLQ